MKDGPQITRLLPRGSSSQWRSTRLLHGEHRFPRNNAQSPMKPAYRRPAFLASVLCAGLMGLCAPGIAPAQPAVPAAATGATPTPATAAAPAPATAAPGAAAPRPPAVPGAPCLIAQFRALALDTHNPTERAALARQWLQRNLVGCSAQKLGLIGSNRAAWLGTADSAELMGMIDTAIEAQAQADPSLLRQLYEPMPRTFQPGVESIRTEPPRPILQPGGSMLMPPVGMISIRQGDRTDSGSGGDPADSGGGASLGAFSDAQRRAVSEYFSQSYEIGECPVGLIARNGRCQSQVPDKPWRFGEPLPRDLAGQARDLPNILSERLGPAPSGRRYVRAGTDVLMLDTDDRVVGAVTDYGQPAVQRRPAPRPAPGPTPNPAPR